MASTTSTTPTASIKLPTDSRGGGGGDDDDDNKVYKVVYRGEPGTLTLTNKTFHYEATNRTDTTIKCSWARVEKRQLSPPNAPKPLLKLVLVSGRTAVFEVPSLTILLALVKEVKQHMEANPCPPSSSSLNDASTDNNNNKDKKKGMRHSTNTAYMSTNGHGHDPTKPPKKGSDKVDVTLVDESSSQSHPQDRLDENQRKRRRKSGYCCPWDSIWFWLCLALFLAIVGLIVTLLVIFVFTKEDDSSGSYYASNKPLCKDTAPDPSKCPPDDGREELYGIRRVEYVWTSDSVRLEYYISDFILTESIGYTILDGVNCRGKDSDKENNTENNENNSTNVDEPVPVDNSWMKSELEDGAPIDGGANLYNEGKGTRQFDIVLTPLDGNVTFAPFYSIDKNSDTKAFLRFCVVFQVFYNQYEGYTDIVEANSIENALQLSLDVEDLDTPFIEDVQIKTVSRPEYH